MCRLCQATFHDQFPGRRVPSRARQNVNKLRGGSRVHGPESVRPSAAIIRFTLPNPKRPGHTVACEACADITISLMVHLILTGATGLVGGCVLHRMLHLETVTKISILSRRPVPQAEGHAKAHTIIHKDFGSYNPGLLEKLRGAEGCVWAQGTSVNNVSKRYV